MDIWSSSSSLESGASVIKYFGRPPLRDSLSLSSCAFPALLIGPPKNVSRSTDVFNIITRMTQHTNEIENGRPAPESDWAKQMEMRVDRPDTVIYKTITWRSVRWRGNPNSPQGNTSTRHVGLPAQKNKITDCPSVTTARIHP